MGFRARRLPDVALAAIAVAALGACTFDAPPLAPATELRARVITLGDGSAAVEVRFRLSPDDDAGRDIVAEYQLMRAQGDAPARPIASSKVEDGIPKGFGALVDSSVLPGGTYRYWVVGNADAEVTTMSGAGAPPSASRPSGSITIPPGRAVADAIGAPALLGVTVPDNSDGLSLALEFRIAPGDDGIAVRGYRLLRAEGNGPFAPFRHNPIAAGPEEHARVRTVTVAVPHAHAYRFQLFALPLRGDPVAAPEELQPVTPEPSYFNTSHTYLMCLVLLTIVLTIVYLWLARQPNARLFIRRIPGIDAIEEAVGRATEMGRPILYVPGIDEIQNIQTIASILILGRIAEIAARYDTEIRVPCCVPLVATIGEEVVRQGFYKAGRPDSHKPQNIQWISNEQFAFCAGTNGIMLRDKPATNIFLGRFFAESLILAETGYVNRAIQIAGTAEITQLPFFIAACDYTLIGEELFAVSAYMSREPSLLATLKAADVIKAIVAATLVVGAVLTILFANHPFAKAFLDFIAAGGQ